MIRLSPLNLSNLLGQFRAVEERAAEKTKREAERVTMYACPDCQELHSLECEALECCESGLSQEPEENASRCPVCAQQYGDSYYAADCCLWKDLTQEQRHHVAKKVQCGSDWITELQRIGAQGLQP